MSQFSGAFARHVHGFNAAVVQRANVDVQTAANAGDVRHVFRLIGHDGASAAGQKDVGNVVDSYVVGDVVHKWHRCANALETNSKHDFSLRWHYPNQVFAVEGQRGVVHRRR